MKDIRTQTEDPFASAGSAALTAGAPTDLLNATQGLIRGIQGGESSVIPPGMSMGAMAPTPTPPQPPVPGVRGGGLSQPAQGEFATRSGNRRAGLNNLLGTISRTVDRFSEHEEQKKVRSMSMDIQTLFTAMEGAQQAQASGDQENLQKNNQIINDLLSDPKKQKSLQKALNIKLFGGKNDKDANSPERQALNHAMQEWVKGGKKGLSPQAQQLMSKIPSTMQMNPQVAMLAQLVKANLIPGAKEKMEWQKQAAQTLGDALKTGFNIQSKEKIADLLVQSKDMASRRSLLGAIVRAGGQENAARINAAARIKEAGIKAKALTDSTVWRSMAGITESILRRTSGKGGNSAYNSLAGSYQKEYTMLDKQATDLRTKLGNTPSLANLILTGKIFSDKDKKAFTEAQANMQLLDQVETKQRQVINKINQLNGITQGIGEQIVTGDSNKDQGQQNAGTSDQSDKQLENELQQWFESDEGDDNQ